ncbi:MAG: DedA family protein [Butyrivibrio sp.]|nr:DedA family protein [Butyrivibrio sp.]
MDISTITLYFTKYGAIAIFVIVLLEYMNLPGFPAGVIMPLSGIWAAKGNINFLSVMLITLLAGVVGSWILYFLGWTGGSLFLEKYLKKFPKSKEAIDRNFELIRQKGYVGIFISKLIPMIRTLISIPAGVLKMNFVKYTISSALGVFVWNLVFVGAGYYFGDMVLRYLG